MANYSELIATINDQIKANGNQEISGPVLNAVLQAMVSALGEGCQFMGVATPTTNPGTPDGRVFYLALSEGTYTSFGSTVLEKGMIGVFAYDEAWHYNTYKFGSDSVIYPQFYGTGLDIYAEHDVFSLLKQGVTIQENEDGVYEEVPGSSSEYSAITEVYQGAYLVSNLSTTVIVFLDAQNRDLGLSKNDFVVGRYVLLIPKTCSRLAVNEKARLEDDYFRRLSASELFSASKNGVSIWTDYPVDMILQNEKSNINYVRLQGNSPLQNGNVLTFQATYSSTYTTVYSGAVAVKKGDIFYIAGMPFYTRYIVGYNSSGNFVRVLKTKTTWEMVSEYYVHEDEDISYIAFNFQYSRLYDYFGSQKPIVCRVGGQNDLSLIMRNVDRPYISKYYNLNGVFVHEDDTVQITLNSDNNSLDITNLAQSANWGNSCNAGVANPPAFLLRLKVNRKVRITMGYPGVPTGNFVINPDIWGIIPITARIINGEIRYYANLIEETTAALSSPLTIDIGGIRAYNQGDFLKDVGDSNILTFMDKRMPVYNFMRKDDMSRLSSFTTSDGRIKLVAFGDSITVGSATSRDKALDYKVSYSMLIAEYLNAELTNLATGGWTVSRIYADAQLEKIPENADIILMTGGTNGPDLGDTSEIDVDSTDKSKPAGLINNAMSYIYEHCPLAFVVFIAPPYIRTDGLENQQKNVNDYQVFWKLMSEKYNVPFVDWRSNMCVNKYNENSMMPGEGADPAVHPTSLLQRRMANMVLKVLPFKI